MRSCGLESRKQILERTNYTIRFFAEFRSFLLENTSYRPLNQRKILDFPFFNHISSILKPFREDFEDWNVQELNDGKTGYAICFFEIWREKPTNDPETPE